MSYPARALRISAVLLVCGALALGASACQSTESESAKIEREGAKLVAGAGTVGLDGQNPDVRVGEVVLVHGSGRTAAAVELTDTGTTPQVAVPVLIDVRNAKGASLYRNDIEGIEPSLQEIPLIRAHTQAWWVDDQVLAADVPSAVKVRIGKAKGAPAGAATVTAAQGGGARDAAGAASAGVEVKALQRGSDVAGPYITGTVVNHSGVAQQNMPIFAVALRGGHVVAAGRALVPKLAASAGGHPTVFRIYFVGSPAGARIELTPAPTVKE